MGSWSFHPDFATYGCEISIISLGLLACNHAAVHQDPHRSSPCAMDATGVSSGSRSAGRPGSPKLGLKTHVERLDDTVKLHSEALTQHADAIRGISEETGIRIHDG